MSTGSAVVAPEEAERARATMRRRAIALLAAGVFVGAVIWGSESATVLFAETQHPDGRGESVTDGNEIVAAFVAAFNAKDVDAIMEFFTQEAVYHNMPGEPVQGKEAVRGVIASYTTTADLLDWEILHSAQIGNTVLTERIDRFVIGGKSVVLPVMGAFDLEGGKIAAWRDYFDMATWQRQMGN